MYATNSAGSFSGSLARHLVFPSAGTAPNAANYELGRDNFGTNQMYFNTPSTAGYRFLIGGVDHLTLERTGHYTFDQGAATSAGADTGTIFKFKNAANTALTAGAETIQMDFDFSATQTHATGAIALQRDMIFRQTTHAFVGASTITIAASQAILGAPLAGANATITFGLGQYFPTWASNSGTAVNQFITPAGIANGVGATTYLCGTIYGTTGSAIDLGNQVATTDTLAPIFVTSLTYQSSAGTRTVTNPAGTIFNAPVAGANVVFTNGPYGQWTQTGPARFDGDILLSQITINAANDLTLAVSVANINGATQINRLSPPTSRTACSAKRILIFASNPTIKHNQAAGGGFYPILLQGSVDLVAAANTVLELVWDITNSAWQQVSNKNA